MNFDYQSCVPTKQSLFSIDMLTWRKLVKNQVVSLSPTEKISLSDEVGIQSHTKLDS